MRFCVHEDEHTYSAISWRPKPAGAIGFGPEYAAEACLAGTSKMSRNTSVSLESRADPLVGEVDFSGIGYHASRLEKRLDVVRKGVPNRAERPRFQSRLDRAPVFGGWEESSGKYQLKSGGHISKIL